MEENDHRNDGEFSDEDEIYDVASYPVSDGDDANESDGTASSEPFEEIGEEPRESLEQAQETEETDPSFSATEPAESTEETYPRSIGTEPEEAEEEPEEAEEKTISSDLIRGHINTIILRSLYDGDKYGYEIIAEIERKSHNQYSLKQPSLYSALKRLEKDGYITSYWGGSVGGGRRKYFSLTDEGKEISERNQSEWEYSRTVIDSLISDKEFDFNTAAPAEVDMRVLKQSTSRVPSRDSGDGEYEYEEEPSPEEDALASERAAFEEERLRREEELSAREEELRQREEELERALAERAEAERLAQEEQEREAERLAQEEQERAEAERLAQEEQERAEAERLAQEEQERAEAERLAQEEQERAEAERLAQEEQEREAERLAREEQEREAERLAQEEQERAEAERLAREERERAHAEALRIAKEQQNARIVEMEAFAKERAQYEKMLREQAENFRAWHEREVAAQVSRTREEDEELFRRREQEIIHQNYLNLVNGPSAPQSEELYGEERTDYLYLSKPEPVREYRSIIQKLYNGAIKSSESEKPEETAAPEPVKPAPEPVKPAPEPAPVSAPKETLRVTPAPEKPAPSKAKSAPKSLDGIDFYDLETRAAQDGIRIALAGGRNKTVTETVSHEHLVHKGRALFFSALVVFLLCIAEGSLSLAFMNRLKLPRFYPYFIWGTGLAVLLITGLMYINHYGERALRQTGNLLINTIAPYALCVIVILIVALAAKIEFSDPGQLATYIIFPIVFFFGIVVFGLTYYMQIRPSKEK